MFRILTPDMFTTTPWRNGGGVTHEIARSNGGESWRWRLSVAEVATDGPFSRFDGLSRILTVIAGNGLDLVTPDTVLPAQPLIPVHFSGDLAVQGRLTDGPIRDLNVIFDARHIDAAVQVCKGPAQFEAGPGMTGLLNLAGSITVAGTALPAGSFALGGGGAIAVAAGAVGVLVTLRDRA
jgi:environmental stress-induced protein Ves